jgi:hypothetical protein
MAKKNTQVKDKHLNSVLRRIQDFKTFESQLDDGNPAYPDGYVAQIQQAIDDKLRELGISQPEASNRIISAMHKAINNQRGHESELENLAIEVVKEYYGSLLDNVELDVKIVLPGKPKDQMESGQMQPPPKIEEIEDEDTKMAIYKRRTANDLMQAAGVSTHRIIHMPEVREQLDEIHPELFEIYDELLKLNEVLTGSEDVERMANMYRMMPEGMAGTVKVEWKKKDEADEERAKKVLKELENNEEEIPEEAEELFDDILPVIHARGIDFPMLVHETVKGIYEIILAASIPENEEIAKEVIQNADTFEQEIIGQRVGPQLRQDLLDFVNRHPATDDFPDMNIFERVLGYIVQLPPTEFLYVIRGILEGDEEAENKVNQYIDIIADHIRDYQEQLNAFELKSRGLLDNDEEDYSDEEDYDPGYGEEPVSTQPETINEPQELNYKNMGQAELNYQLNKALDNEDYMLAAEISKYLKNKE